MDVLEAGATSVVPGLNQDFQRFRLLSDEAGNFLDDEDEEQSLLEDLGMVMPSSGPRSGAATQVISGDLSVGEVIKKRQTATHDSHKRQSLFRRATKTSLAGTTLRDVVTSTRSNGAARGTVHRQNTLGSGHASEHRTTGSIKERRGTMHTNLTGEFPKKTGALPPLEMPDDGLADYIGDHLESSERPALLHSSTAPFSEPGKSTALLGMTKGVHKVMNMVKFLGPRITHNNDADKPSTRVIKDNSKAERMLIVEEIRNLPLFSGCSHKFLGELARTIEEKTIPEGTVLKGDFTSCTRDPHMVLVLRGSLQVIVADHEVMRRTASDYIGEAVLLGLEQDWLAKLKAEATTVVLLIYREDFLSALRFFPSEKQYFDGIRVRMKDHISDGTLRQRCVVFRGFSDATICSLDKVILTRIFFPGEHILKEGRPGDELYMLVSGIAGVEIAGRVVRQERRDAKWKIDEDNEAFLGGPLCFGELGLLGMQKVRCATVLAQTFCHVRVLFRPAFMGILEYHGESIQMEEMADLLARRYEDSAKPATAALKEVRIFQQVGCSDSFLDFLAQHLEDRIFLSGQKIIDETAPDDRCMYLLGQGFVKVIKQNKEVATLQAGAVFGEIIVLGLASKRTASVVAGETCYMQVLHQSVVVRGLELFPDERQKVLQIAFANSPGVADSKPPGADQAHRDDVTVKSPTHNTFLNALKKSSLFATIDAGFVEDLSTVSQDRIYMPGDLIIEEGKRGDSMFIMVSGQATVLVSDPDAVLENGKDPNDMAFMNNAGKWMQRSSLNCPVERSSSKAETTYDEGGHRRTKATSGKKFFQRIGVLTAGSISGELAMLGVSLIRSATIEAQTICSMWEITQEKALAILERYPDAQHHFAQIIVEHLERTVPVRILSLPLFRGFDRKFRMLLGLYCERKAYFPGQRIAREGIPGDRLYIVNQGRATLEKKSVTVKTYASGSYFGSTVMLGVHKVYLGTLTALQTCHMLIISKQSYQQALEQYPSLLAAQELKKTEKAASEELREAIQRISTRKLIWKRYQCQLLDSMNPDAAILTQKELLERALQVWSEKVKRIVKIRRQRERERGQYKQMMEQWVQKRHEARTLLEQRSAERPQGFLRSDAAIGKPVGHRKELVKVLEDWPTPRPSPHYRLRVFGVLHEAATRPATGAPLLPLLKQNHTCGGGGKMVVRDEDDLATFADIDHRMKSASPWWRQGPSPLEDDRSGWDSEESLGEELSLASDCDPNMTFEDILVDPVAGDAEADMALPKLELG